MEGHFLWDIAGTGFWVLLVITGLLALILPGRFTREQAEHVGLGRHVEALLLVSLIITLAIGTTTHVPIFIGPGGVLAFSLLGAGVPTILAFYFLVAAGWKRMLLSLIPIALVSLAAFFTSQPVPDMGIIARPPYYFIPAIVAAAGALLLVGRSLFAIPLAYAYGALGALLGADFMRIEWILSTPLTAASIGGADALDLVFLMGLWAAALVAIPLAPRLLAMRHKDNQWLQVARLARSGHEEAALAQAEANCRAQLEHWTREHGLLGVDPDTILRESTAGAVFAKLDHLRRSPQPWDAKQVRRLLEDLAGLERRLQAPYLENVAPRQDRLLAGAIDLLPVILIAGVALFAAFQIPLAARPGEDPTEFLGRRFAAGAILVLWSTVAFHVLYPFFAEWWTGGRTLGKLIMGLHVQSRDGTRPTGWAFFVRNLSRIVDLLFAYLLPFITNRERGRERLGDYFAGTYVAKSATSIQNETPSENPMPTNATQWSLETTRPPR